MFLTFFAFFGKLLHAVLGIGSPKGFPPPLSAEEERAFFSAAQNGDERAREQLILHNLRLVSHIVRKYYSTAKDQEDLVSIGTLGLVKAVDSFNDKNGARFATYAAKCIQNEILMHFRADKKHASEVSIQETIDTDREGNPLTYMDVIRSDEDMTEDLDRAMVTEKMLHYMDKLLTPRERRVLSLHYGLGCAEMTQREIADALHISRSYVSRIEKSALEKLRDALE